MTAPLRSQKYGSRGFTLIELLVVIAIIGVLAAVVLAALQSGRNKSADAAIKASLASIRTQAQIYANASGGSFGADLNHGATNCSVNTGVASTLFYLDTNIRAALASAEAKGGSSRCVVADGTSYALAVRLTASTSATATWCIDSSGSSKELTALPNFGSATAVCP